jgi:hypothetical protein
MSGFELVDPDTGLSQKAASGPLIAFAGTSDLTNPNGRVL